MTNIVQINESTTLKKMTPKQFNDALKTNVSRQAEVYSAWHEIAMNTLFYIMDDCNADPAFTLWEKLDQNMRKQYLTWMRMHSSVAVNANKEGEVVSFKITDKAKKENTFSDIDLASAYQEPFFKIAMKEDKVDTPLTYLEFLEKIQGMVKRMSKQAQKEGVNAGDKLKVTKALSILEHLDTIAQADTQELIDTAQVHEAKASVKAA